MNGNHPPTPESDFEDMTSQPSWNFPLKSAPSVQLDTSQPQWRFELDIYKFSENIERLPRQPTLHRRGRGSTKVRPAQKS